MNIDPAVGGLIAFGVLVLIGWIVLWILERYW